MTSGSTSGAAPRGAALLRKWLKDALIVASISVAIVVAIEIFLRLFLPQDLQGESIVGEHFNMEDPELGMKYAAGAHWKFRHPEYRVEYRINDHGFRDHTDHAVPAPAGVTRVLLLGDSFTFGQGVDYDETWPRIAELRLGTDSTIELVKAGIQGMDTRSELLLVQRLADQFDCDAVVVAFLINDLYTNTLDGIQESTHAVQLANHDGNEEGTSWKDTMKRVFVRNDRDMTFHLLTLGRRLAVSNPRAYCGLYLATPDRKNWLVEPLPPEQAHQASVTATLFERFFDYCASRNLPAVVLSIPQQFQVLYETLGLEDDNVDVRLHDRTLGLLARQHDVTWIETLPHLERVTREQDEELFFRLDGHLNAEGNEAVAEVFLREALPAIERRVSALRTRE